MEQLPKWHYYESHVTVEPVFEDRLEQFKKICAFHKFRVAGLLMKRREFDIPERSKYDSFCTSRNGNLNKLLARTILLVQDLQWNGFKVWRYKIESTLFDSRYDDVFNLIK